MRVVLIDLELNGVKGLTLRTLFGSRHFAQKLLRKLIHAFLYEVGIKTCLHERSLYASMHNPWARGYERRFGPGFRALYLFGSAVESPTSFFFLQWIREAVPGHSGSPTQ